ncbi:MAG: hypothetical protein ACRD2B_05030 [Terriglobia bacterium]
MSLIKRSAILVFVTGVFFCSAIAWGQGNYKTATIGAPNASGIPSAVVSAVGTEGIRFESSQGTPVCEVWWSKSIPMKANAGASGDVLYSGLTVGEFVGLIHFPPNSKDYRGQNIKQGYYTLRYALIPQDGNHMGVSNYRDFLLLIPVADDSNPSQVLDFNNLVKESRLATGTGHPGVMMLDPASQSAAFPSAVQDDQGNWALDVKLDTQKGGQNQQLPFAVVLVGQYQG